MNIDSLNRGNSLYQAENNPIKAKYKDQRNETSANISKAKAEDKLEISEEVIKLAPIKAKIAQGFYENPEILKEVATRLYKEISEDEDN